MNKIDSYIGDEDELKSNEFNSEEQKNNELKKKMKRVFLGIFVVLSIFLTLTVYNFFFNIHPFDKQPVIYLKNNDMFMKNSDIRPIQFTHDANITSLDNGLYGRDIVSGENHTVYRSESKHFLCFILNGDLYIKADFLKPKLVDNNVTNFKINKDGNRILYVKDKYFLYFYKYGSKTEQICDKLWSINSNIQWTRSPTDKISDSYGFTEDDKSFYYYTEGENDTKLLFYGSSAKNTEVAQESDFGKSIISNQRIIYANNQGLFYKKGSSDKLEINSDDKNTLLFADDNFGYYYINDYETLSESGGSLFYGKTSNATKIADGIRGLIGYNPKLSVISYFKNEEGEKNSTYIKRTDQKNQILVAKTAIRHIEASKFNIDFNVISDNKDFATSKFNIQFDNDYKISLYLEELNNQIKGLTIDSGDLFMKQYKSGSFGSPVKIDDNVLNFQLSSDGKRVVYLKKIEADGQNTVSLFYREIGNQSIEIIKNVEADTLIKCGRDLEGITYLDDKGNLFLSDKGESPNLLQSDVKTYNINNIGTISIITNTDNSLFVANYNKAPIKVDEGVDQIIFY